MMATSAMDKMLSMRTGMKNFLCAEHSQLSQPDVCGADDF